MCNELNVPLAKIRAVSDRDELSEKWNELSTCDFGTFLMLFIIVNLSSLKKSGYIN